MATINKGILGLFIIDVIIVLISGTLGFYFNTDIVLLICFFIPLLYQFKFFKITFLKYLFFHVMTVWNVLSVFAINNTIMRLPNAQLYSHHTTAMFPLVLTEVSCSFFLLLIERQKRIRIITDNKIIPVCNTREKKDQIRWITILLVACIVVFIFEIAGKNYYISGAADRFYYERSVKAMSLRFYGYLLFMIPIVSMNAALIKNTKYLKLFVSLYILYIFLVGGKFGPFAQTFYILLLSYFIPFKKKELKKNFNKIIFATIILASVLVTFSAIQMTIENGSVQRGLIQLYDRLFNGQGDVWWCTYDKIGGKTHIGELSDELGAFSLNGDQLTYNFGIYKMMSLIAPLSVLERYAVKGARFTMSTNASLYYYFGITGLLIIRMIMVLIQTFLVNTLLCNIEKFRWAESFCITWLLIHFMGVLSMSSFDLFVCRSAILCYGILMAFRLFRNNKVYLLPPVCPDGGKLNDAKE